MGQNRHSVGRLEWSWVNSWCRTSYAWSMCQNCQFLIRYWRRRVTNLIWESKVPNTFLDAPSHFYKRVCPSVRWSVGPSACSKTRSGRIWWPVLALVSFFMPRSPQSEGEGLDWAERGGWRFEKSFVQRQFVVGGSLALPEYDFLWTNMKLVRLRFWRRDLVF